MYVLGAPWPTPRCTPRCQLGPYLHHCSVLTNIQCKTYVTFLFTCMAILLRPLRVLHQEHEFALSVPALSIFSCQVIVLLIPQVQKRRSCLDQSCCRHTRYHHARQRTVCTASSLSRQNTQTCAPTTSRLIQESSWCSGWMRLALPPSYRRAVGTEQ